MKRIQTILAALLLGLMSLGAQAQRADELAVDGQTSAQEQRQQRGARGSGAPTLRDVRQAARDGDIAKARALVDQVLQSQPANARAQLVKAQLAARDNDVATARSGLQAAERLAPGLPFAREEQVTNLRKRLERMEARDARGGQPQAGRNARDSNISPRAEAPVESPITNNAGSTATASNSGSAPAETRPAGEDTRNMGAPAPRTGEKASNSLIMGVLIGGGVVAALAFLLFRRRRPSLG